MFDPTRYKLKQNARGYWDIRWTENRGDRFVQRTHSTRETERAAAQAYLRQWLRAQEELERQLAGVPDMAELIDRYEINANHRRVGKTQRLVLARLRSFFGHMNPATISENDVLKYGISRGVADATLRRELGALVAVLNFGVRKKLLTPGDIPHIDLPPQGQPREVYLSPSEEADFMAFLKRDPASNFSRFCFLALRTGARKSAIKGLTWDRVDLVHRTVDYRDPNARVSKKRRVPVPIDDVLLPVLEMASMFATDQYVIGRGSVQRMFDKVRAEHPEFAKITPHVLRHTAATRWLRAGMSVWDVAGLLGDTVETTTKVYGHHSTSDLRAAMSRFAA